MKRKNNFYGVSIYVYILGIASLINDISSEIVKPLLPFFLSALGGGGIAIGLIGGLIDAVPKFFKVVVGYWSDKIGKRKIFVVYGYFLSFLAKITIPFVYAWQILLIVIPIERIGKAIREAPRDVMITKYSDPKNKGKSFGVRKALDSAGAVIGSVMALLFLLTFKLKIRSIILIAGILSIGSVVALLFIKETKEKGPKPKSFLKGIRFSRKFWFFVTIASIFSLANFTYMFYILKASGKEDLGYLFLPVIFYILFNISYTLFSIPAGQSADRFGKKRVLLIGYFVFSLTALGFTIFTSFFTFILLFILYGLSYAIIETVQITIVADIAPKERKGSAIGTFHTITGICLFLSSLIAGVIWVINPSFTFFYGFGISFLAMILLAFFKIR